MTKIRDGEGAEAAFDANRLAQWLRRELGVGAGRAERIARVLGDEMRKAKLVPGRALRARAVKLAALPKLPARFFGRGGGILADIDPTGLIGPALEGVGFLGKLLEDRGYVEVRPGCFKREPGIPAPFTDNAAPDVAVDVRLDGECDVKEAPPDSLGEELGATDQATACKTGNTGYCVKFTFTVTDDTGWFGGNDTGVRTISVCTLVTGADGKISQGPCRHIKLKKEEAEATEDGQKTFTFYLCVAKGYAQNRMLHFLCEALDGGNNGTLYKKSVPVS